MSLLPGGRTDKTGNEYEKHYLAILLLRLVNGELTSITVEPVGPNKDSVEYTAVDKAGNRYHYQCKLSNGTQNKWRTCDLKEYDVFNRAREIIETDPKNIYVFVSPLSYGELDQLCDRARTSASVEDLKNQLTNKEIRKAWEDCAKQLRLNESDDTDARKMMSILSRWEFVTVPFSMESKRDLSSRVNCLFSGDSKAARELLENYANSNQRFVVPITADEIIHAMSERGHKFRKHLYGENNITKINSLNEIFLNSFHPINSKIIHRSETDKVLAEITNGNSVILHGKAGYGKSGCVYEIVNKLRENGTLLLALNLAHDPPSTTSEQYGKALGLTQSPVYCLYNIAAGKPCMLILDQLDALRWTSQHSSSALAVCKQLISEANNMNKHFDGHISLVFITRTFDLETDANLRNLFSNDENKTFRWSKEEISHFSAGDVINVIDENYNTLSHKLQNLLLTPSSLYIWTTLTDSSAARNITTPFELMEKWWEQILENCESTGISKSAVTSLRDTIVDKLEKRPDSKLPRQFFIDSQKELQAMISNGLLVENNNAVSFSHQSFLDHFAVSNMVTKIYDGASILEVTDNRDKQTPYMRYRLLRVLQILSDDEDTLLGVCDDILRSEEVRYYFKCAVFEVMGQCENPGDALLEYAYGYFENPDWHSYVYNTVYLGHPAFVQNLNDHGRYDWSANDGLELLRSINTKAQDFVYGKISPFCFQTEEKDKELYLVLSHSCANDSPEILEFRLKLLHMYPELWPWTWNTWDFSSGSANLIPMLRQLIEDIDQVKSELYIRESDRIGEFISQFYHEIISEILPVICEKTMLLNFRWPNYAYGENYSRWKKSGYVNSTARDIVEMAKAALCEFAAKEPPEFMAFAKEFDGRNSVVYYEILAETVYSLGTAYSDFAVSWLCDDPQNHFLIYTDNAEDYLSLAKKMIKKFSPYCSKDNFSRLENLILNWSDPAGEMIAIYNQRREVNQTKRYKPVYYAFWGHFQKTLLPFLDETRTSQETKQLIRVLERNEWIRTPYYKSSFQSDSSPIVSPVSEKADRIYDKTWLRIISTPESKMKNDSWKMINGIIVEANHREFSRAFSEQAKHQPERFAKLSLQFPDECYRGYINGVINAMYENNADTKVDFQLTCDVVNRFMSDSDPDVTIQVLRLIGRRAEENWPDNILNFVCDAAINSTHPSPDFSATADKEVTPHSLLTNALSCVRGCAIETISELLWKHNDLADRFKPAIEHATQDPYEAVRFISFTGAYPYYNLDRDFCINILKKLIQNEQCILGHHDIWQILCRDYRNNSDFYVKHLKKACRSEIDELSENAADYLCAIVIYYDFNIVEQLYRIPLNTKQIERVCLQAASSFDDEQFHTNSKAILLHYLNSENLNMFGYNKLFLEKKIDINRDEDLLIKLLRSKPKDHLLQTILEYINSHGKDISKYVDTLQTFCEELASNENRFDRETTVTELIKCIIKLMDRTRRDPGIQTKCLDMWDDIYRSCFNMPFTQIFDNIS